jgi:hypothetical protein
MTSDLLWISESVAVESACLLTALIAILRVNKLFGDYAILA